MRLWAPGKTGPQRARDTSETHHRSRTRAIDLTTFFGRKSFKRRERSSKVDDDVFKRRKTFENRAPFPRRRIPSTRPSARRLFRVGVPSKLAPVRTMMLSRAFLLASFGVFDEEHHRERAGFCDAFSGEIFLLSSSSETLKIRAIDSLNEESAANNSGRLSSSFIPPTHSK